MIRKESCAVVRSMIPFFSEKIMADVNLKKLSRAELLEMMISFSEEAEAARQHEEELKKELEREKIELQQEMAKERAQMLKSFDEEKAEMREMKAKDDEVNKKLAAIEKSGTLAEAVVNITGLMEKAQEAIDLYTNQMHEREEWLK